MPPLLLCHADRATANAAAGVSRGLPEVVGLRVHDDRAPDEGVAVARERRVLDGGLVVGLPLRVGLQVPEVAGVAVLVLARVAVGVLLGVVVAARTLRVAG